MQIHSAPAPQSAQPKAPWIGADAVLARLVRVRRTGSESWMACCPAHEDRTPSLSIREYTGPHDGRRRVSVHCFAGCDRDAILDAIALDWRALVEPPERPSTPCSARRLRPWAARFSAAELLEALDSEATAIAVLGGRLRESGALSSEEWSRLAEAVGRVQQIRDYANASR